MSRLFEVTDVLPVPQPTVSKHLMVTKYNSIFATSGAGDGKKINMPNQISLIVNQEIKNQ